MKSLDMALGINERPALQWSPGADAWLLLGHLLVDSKTGTVLGRIGKEPTVGWDLQPRRFIGQNLLTTIVNQGQDRQLAFSPYPNKN
jgi:hypothetical protein